MPSKKEIVRKAISLQQVHPIPYWISFTLGARKMLQEHLHSDNLDAFLGNFVIDAFANSLHGVMPADLKGDTWEDDFGVVWKGAGVDRGAPYGHPLAEDASLKKYKFPDPADPRRFSHLDQFLKDNSDLFTIVCVDFGLLFERAWYLRGMENLLMDFYLNPAFVDDLLDSLLEYYLQSIEIISAFKGFDAVCLIDDYGIQHRLIIAPQLWRRFFKPRLKKIVEALTRHGLIAHLHSCGNVTQLVGDFIEIGISVLDPLQPGAMDAGQIKKKFGHQLTLLGGFSTQEIIPKAEKQQVKQHIEDCLATLGKGGGYIASNGIPLQTDVPLENMLTVIDVLKNQ